MIAILKYFKSDPMDNGANLFSVALGGKSLKQCIQITRKGIVTKY